MGADLLLTWVPIPEGDPDTVRDTLRQRIMTLDDEALGRVLETKQGDDLPTTPEDDEALDGEFGGPWRDAIRAYLTEAVDLLLTEDKDLPRDLVRATIGGRGYLFSGGTSWGDSPGDSWDAVNALDESGILLPEALPPGKTKYEVEVIVGVHADSDEQAYQKVDQVMDRTFHGDTGCQRVGWDFWEMLSDAVREVE